MHVLVAYASQEGQTEKIAHHVARAIERHGHLARLIEARDALSGTEVGDFDAAIVAGSLHIGRHGPPLAAFVAAHRDRLNAVPSAFLSVSLAAASPDRQDRDGAAQCVEAFEAESGWRPDRELLVAGAVHDRRTSFWKRWLLHWLLARKGVTLDPSGETEFTNWAALDTFVHQFLAETAARRRPNARS